MLSLASAVFDGQSEEPLASFSMNLEVLEGAVRDPDTTLFWEKHPEAYAATRIYPWPVVVVMREYVGWLRELKGRPVFVGYPAAFDSLFVFWYLHTFAEDNPFGWQALDIKTYAMAVLGTSFSSSVKANFPAKWFSDKKPHTHVALEDAIEQGVLFTRILKHNTDLVKHRYV
jgi:hypothetical protein